jgi:hypothetical protein
MIFGSNAINKVLAVLRCVAGLYVVRVFGNIFYREDFSL